MRFKQFLTEEVTTEKIQALAEDCKPFFKNYSHIKPMYRGQKDTNPWFKRASRISGGREPMTMRDTLHNMWNQVFRTKFGWRCRNGVMVTGNRELADDYASPGYAHYFIPCGEFKYVWSPKIHDLYLEHGSIDYLSLGKGGHPLGEEGTREEMRKVVDTYKDTGLNIAVQSDSEISFNCQEYYLIAPRLIEWRDLVHEVSKISE